LILFLYLRLFRALAGEQELELVLEDGVLLQICAACLAHGVALGRVEELGERLDSGPSKVSLELVHRSSEAVYEVVFEDWILLLQEVHALAHFLSVLDDQTDILLLNILLQGSSTSVGEGALVTVHLTGGVKTAAVVGQLEVHVIVKLGECEPADFTEVKSNHVLREVRQQGVYCQQVYPR